jgi:ribosomal protein S20
VVVLDDQYLDNVDSALTKADKKVNKAIDKGDYDAIEKAINDASDNVDDAIDS